jgi:hypothetical protein
MSLKVNKRLISALLIGTITLTGCLPNSNDIFKGLSPKAIYGDYKIYDLVEQRNLMCAEAIEFLEITEEYEYYFNCLKSDQIFLVGNNQVIKVKVAYDAGIIDAETLYELGIISRNTVTKTKAK